MSSIAEYQQRVLENMKALKRNTAEKALVERYARELNAQEGRIQALQREVSDLRQRREGAWRTLNDMIEGMTLEARL